MDEYPNADVIDSERLRQSFIGFASDLDLAFAEAARRYKGLAAIASEELASAMRELRRLSGDGGTKYDQLGVPLEYLLNFQGPQVNAALMALYWPILEHDGPIRIIDIGSGTGTVPISAYLILRTLERQQLVGNRTIEFIAVEPSRWMSMQGRLVHDHVERRLALGLGDVAWFPKIKDVPTTPTGNGRTWIVGAHVMRPFQSSYGYARAFESMARHFGADQIILTSSRRRCDYDTIWDVQSSLRRLYGVGRGTWDLMDKPSRGPYPLIFDARSDVLDQLLKVSSEVHASLNEWPVPRWYRNPPHVYRLGRACNTVGVAA